MTAILKPTHEQLLDGRGIPSVHRHRRRRWNGCYVYQVFHRESDDTYWAANYRLSSDGETNELREGLAEIRQVWPVERTIIEYAGRPPS